MSKGESLVDTVRTVEALGAHMLVIRHSVSGAPYLAAEVFGGSVLNGGDGWHAHPTQALLDLYTIRAHLGDASLKGRKVVILGDLLHSRVARSNIWTLTAAGADLWLCGPATLLRGFEAWAGRGAAAGRRFHVTTSVDEALRDADVVMALRIQRERMASGLLPSLREYAARYGLTAERLRLAKPGALVMHPGPMNEGVEIAADVAAGPQLGHHRPGHQRRRGPDGAALPAGRHAQPGRRGRGRQVTDLDIGRAWLVDPVAGREGPGEIVVRDGILEAVDLARGRGCGRHRRRRGRRRAGLHRPARPPARARQRGCRDGRERAGGGRPRRVHDRLRDAEHDAGARRARGAGADPGGGRGVRVAGRAARDRRGDDRPGGGDRSRRSGELADAGAVGFSDDGAPVRSAAILRNALAYAGALGLPIIDHPEDPTLTDGAEANEGLVATVLGLRGWPGAAEAGAVARATRDPRRGRRATCPARGST